MWQPGPSSGSVAIPTVSATGLAELMRKVWGPGFGGDPNIVEVYIGYLRKKVDLPFGRHSIETVRGYGYRLAVEDEVLHA